jgi:NaMN:DMB phosphoribosyltransferase
MTLITPEFLPTKTYPFSQLRQAINDIGGGLQEGVVGGTDLGVAQRAQPIHLGMRLGEGTGAALGIGLLRAALACYREMATFEEAGVTRS